MCSSVTNPAKDIKGCLIPPVRRSTCLHLRGLVQCRYTMSDMTCQERPCQEVSRGITMIDCLETPEYTCALRGGKSRQDFKKSSRHVTNALDLRPYKWPSRAFTPAERRLSSGMQAQVTLLRHLHRHTLTRAARFARVSVLRRYQVGRFKCACNMFSEKIVKWGVQPVGIQVLEALREKQKQSQCYSWKQHSDLAI